MDGIERLGDGLSQVWDATLDWAPEIILALLVLGLGLRLAGWIRSGLNSLFDRDWFKSVTSALGIGEPMERVGSSAAHVLVSAIYGTLVVFVLLISTEVLGVRQISTGVEAIVRIVPGILAAALVVIIASRFGRFVADLARPWSTASEVGWLPTAIRWGFLLMSILTGFEVLGFGDLNLRLVEFGLLGLALITVIALGVGGIPAARGWWEQRHPAAAVGNEVDEGATGDETTDGGKSQ